MEQIETFWKLSRSLENLLFLCERVERATRGRDGKKTFLTLLINSFTNLNDDKGVYATFKKSCEFLR